MKYIKIGILSDVLIGIEEKDGRLYIERYQRISRDSVDADNFREFIKSELKE